MSKRSEYLKGKSFSSFINMSAEEFSDLQKSGNEWKLRATVTAMASAVNKRLREFQKRDIQTPATNYIEDKFGTRISTKDLTKGQLTSLFFELKGFGEAETSTISGWNRVKEKVTDRMADEGIDITDVDYDEYWDAFDAIIKMNKNRIAMGIPGASEFDPDIKYKVLEYVKQKIIKYPDMSDEGVAKSLFRKRKHVGETIAKSNLDRLYEELEDERRAKIDRISTARYL